MSKRFLIEPTDLVTANSVIARLHRHAGQIGVAMHQVKTVERETGKLVGVGILGRPVSRVLDDGFTLEVSRTATDGTEHACSAILGALAREARRIRLRGNPIYRMTTYTRISEAGSSLRAAGWRLDTRHHVRFVADRLSLRREIVPIQPKSWSHSARIRPQRDLGEPRLRWLKLLPEALTEEAAFKLGQAAAVSGALITSNPYSYSESQSSGTIAVIFVGDQLWEIWREGYGCATPALPA